MSGSYQPGFRFLFAIAVSMKSAKAVFMLDDTRSLEYSLVHQVNDDILVRWKEQCRPL